MDLPVEIVGKIESGKRVILMPIERSHGQRAWLCIERLSDSFFRIATIEPGAESINELRTLNHGDLAMLLSKLSERDLPVSQ